MHDCYLCGCACYCHGDIDDCQVETIEYAYEHCEGCGCGEDPHEFDYGDGDPDEYWEGNIDWESIDFDFWRKEYTPPCVMHRNVHCSRCHA